MQDPRRHAVISLWAPCSAIASLLLLGTFTAHPLAAAPRIIGLGVQSGYHRSWATDMSADGRVVVGVSHQISREFDAFRWEEGEGIASVGSGIVNRNIAYGVSPDGNVIVGMAGQLASYWSDENGFNVLGDFPGGYESSYAVAVSERGRKIVGSGYGPLFQEAFVWTKDNGLRGLGSLPMDNSSSATNITPDGNTVFGYSFLAQSETCCDRVQAFRWTESDGMRLLFDLPQGINVSGLAGVSSDGKAIVGSLRHDEDTVTAFRWTQEGGLLSLGTLPESNSSNARDVSDDGRIVIGYVVTSTADYESFVWDSIHGMRSLRDVLASEYGMEEQLTGWTLNFAEGMSNDGRVVFGNGTNPEGKNEAFVITGLHLVPEPSTLALLGTGIAIALLSFAGRAPRSRLHATGR